MSRLLDALRPDRVLLMDGAMGTELQRAGLPAGEAPETWTLTRPERVRAIHRAYVEAGADVLVTNTFQANPTALARTAYAHELPEFLRAGARLAAELPSRPIVLQSVGPILNTKDVEFGDLRQLTAVLPGESPIDGILLETCSSPRVRYAVRRFVAASGLPVLLSLTYLRDYRGQLVTASGHAPEWFARRAEAWQVAALGVNCGLEIGMDEIIELVRRYRGATNLPLFARPNAGTPTRVDNRWDYPRTPEGMAGRLPELLEAGVSMVGGCCGTTPAHIAAFRPVVDAWNASATWRRGPVPPASRP